MFISIPKEFFVPVIFSDGFILNQESDLTQLFMDTKEFFRIDEIVKETMSLRDLYIHYREGGL